MKGLLSKSLTETLYKIQLQQNWNESSCYLQSIIISEVSALHKWSGVKKRKDWKCMAAWQCIYSTLDLILSYFDISNKWASQPKAPLHKCTTSLNYIIYHISITKKVLRPTRKKVYFFQCDFNSLFQYIIPLIHFLLKKTLILNIIIQTIIT